MERIKLFENTDMNLLERDVNKFIGNFGPSIVVKDIRYKMAYHSFDGKNLKSVWTAMVRYENNIPSNMPPKEIELYDDGRPIFEAANDEELADAIAAYAGELEAPYVVRFPKGIECIESWAFNENGSIDVILFSDSVTSIESSAFDCCPKLTAVTIPNSVTSIGHYAFHNCSGLTSIIVKAGNSKYDSRDNCNAIIEKKTNKLICGCMNTIIPNSVKEIEAEVFVGSNITTMDIPNSVDKIGEYAFADCKKLTKIKLSDNIKEIPEMLFANCTNLTCLTIPNSVTSIDKYAFQGCENLKEIHIQNPALLKNVDLSDCKDVKIITP